MISRLIQVSPVGARPYDAIEVLVHAHVSVCGSRPSERGTCKSSNSSTLRGSSGRTRCARRHPPSGRRLPCSTLRGSPWSASWVWSGAPVLRTTPAGRTMRRLCRPSVRLHQRLDLTHLLTVQATHVGDNLGHLDAHAAKRGERPQDRTALTAPSEIFSAIPSLPGSDSERPRPRP